MITTHLMALKASIRTLLLIGILATVGAGVLTLGLGMDTPWAPLGEAIRYYVPPPIIHASKFRGYCCLLRNYGCLPYLGEDAHQ